MRLFVGYDPDEALALPVFAHSVHRRSSLPVSVQPLIVEQLAPIFNRPREDTQSTSFSFARYLVPHLCGYEGWALYCDGDMICRADIAELWRLRDEGKAVMVVKRGEQPVTRDTKFLGRPQRGYARKNWSSVMLFNCGRCRYLVPDYVEHAPAMDLRQFKWLDDDEIGGLPAEWNHLVSVDAPNPEAKIVHYTLGLPLWHGYHECEFANEWRSERDAMLHYRREGARTAA